uniref:Protein kinase domain-containing protein n=1 Tax=Leersia perrieri TaxID=77586 RepID=A0A0D9XIB5_9ORYZ
MPPLVIVGSFATCFLLFCFLSPFYRVADAAGAPVLQALNCNSTAGNYTQDSDYAANLGRLLVMLPNETVTKNGGFFNGSVGNGTATVYGLALCPADFTRADCMDCLTAAGNSAGGVVKRCPGVTTVSAMFDQCLLRYSDIRFFGIADTDADADIPYATNGKLLTGSDSTNRVIKPVLPIVTTQAASSPTRFAVSETNPYTMAQCTWDLPSDKCKACLDVLSANISATFPANALGERKTYSCRIRYEFNTSFMVVPFNLTTGTTPLGTPAEPGSSTTKNNGPVMIGLIVAAVVFVVLIAVVIWLCVRHRAIKKVALAGPRSYSYDELYAATNGFSEERKLGQGAFGAVYRGILADESKSFVAVKKMQRMSEAAWKEFVAEITIVTQLKHRNIVDLIGWCEDRNNPLLVYELMDRNLDYHLYPPQYTDEKSVVLDWKKRYNIIVDMANGLQYLHTARNECVLHRDIKPSNVMLDENLTCAKLCDFGLVKQINYDEVGPGRQTTIIGTRSYLDPECMRTSIVRAASDVYSFGLVLLEIACGRQPTMLQHGHRNKNSLVEWVQDSFRQRKSVAEMADERLQGEFDKEQVELVIRVGFLCVLPDPDKRPDMATVLDYLKGRSAVPAAEPYPASPGSIHAANNFESSPASLLV